MKKHIVYIFALIKKHILSPQLPLVVISACLFLAVASLIDRVLAVGIIFSVFLFYLTLFFINKYVKDDDHSFVSNLFIIAFIIHILAAFFVYYSNFQPFSGGYGDYVIYQIQATEIAENVRKGIFSLDEVYFGINQYYPVIVGYIYAVTVPSMIMGQLFNAWLIALVVVFVYLIGRQIGGGQKESFLAGLAANFYPSLAFFGSLMLKDACVALACLVALFLAIKTIKNFSIPGFLAFFAALMAVIHFRFYAGYAILFSFIISWFLASNLGLRKRFIYGVIMVFLLGLAPLFLGQGYYGYNHFKQFLNVKSITYYRETVYAPQEPKPDSAEELKTDSAKETKPDAVEIFEPVKTSQVFEELKQKTKTEALKDTEDQKAEELKGAVAQKSWGKGSSMLIKTGLDNPLTFIKNSLWSFANVLLGPFPWQLTSLRHLLTLPEVIGWYFLLFFIVKGIIESIRKKNTIILPLIIFSCLVMGVLALFMSNFGIITRIRISAFLSLLCILPLGLQNFDQNKILQKLKAFKTPFLK